MGNVQNGQSTTTKPEIRSEELLNAIGDTLSDLANSEDEDDGEDEDDDQEDTGHGKLSEEDELGWVMATISKPVQHRMEGFRQKQLRLDEQRQPGWGDAVDYFHERDIKYETTQLKVLVVGKHQADSTAATPSPTTFEELMQALDILPGQSQMPLVTSRQGTSQMTLGLEKPHADKHIIPPMPTVVPDWSLIVIAKAVQPVSFYPCT
jgi:hypothetical protein